MTDADLARAAAAAYTAAPTWAAGDVHAVRTGNVIAFRGTVPTSTADWLRDFDAVPVTDPDLGICHQGFLDGARAIFPEILMQASAAPVILTGHSLGGALAVITAGLLTVAGRPPAELVTFGAPRAAGPKLRVLLAHVPVRQYHYGDDPVPMVPWLPGVFEHMRALVQIGWPALNPIADHSIAKYEAEVAGAVAAAA